jgi:hypothetical protein
VSLDKSIHGNEFRSPPIDIDDLGVPLVVITDYIRTGCGGKMDNGMSPPGKLSTHQ